MQSAGVGGQAGPKERERDNAVSGGANRRSSRSQSSSSSYSSHSQSSSSSYSSNVGIRTNRWGGGAAFPIRIGNERNLFQLGDEIGQGANGVVFSALNVVTGDLIAAKRCTMGSRDDGKVDESYLSGLETEIALMQKLNHPNIVKYIDTIRSPASKHLYIILEYMEQGSLAHVLKRFGAMSESLAAVYISQVLQGLEYLHDQGVLHRDIKGANVLTNKEGVAKLCDFGVATELATQQFSLEPEGASAGGAKHVNDVLGTPYWMAPEVIEMSPPTALSDMWSVGCLAVELVTGRPPYHEMQPMAAMFHIVQDDFPRLPPAASEDLLDFLTHCFQKEPTRRMPASELLRHQWLRAAVRSNEMRSPGRVLAASYGLAPAAAKEAVVPAPLSLTAPSSSSSSAGVSPLRKAASSDSSRSSSSVASSSSSNSSSQPQLKIEAVELELATDSTDAEGGGATEILWVDPDSGVGSSPIAQSSTTEATTLNASPSFTELHVESDGANRADGEAKKPLPLPLPLPVPLPALTRGRTKSEEAQLEDFSPLRSKMRLLRVEKESESAWASTLATLDTGDTLKLGRQQSRTFGENLSERIQKVLSQDYGERDVELLRAQVQGGTSPAGRKESPGRESPLHFISVGNSPALERTHRSGKGSSQVGLSLLALSSSNSSSSNSLGTSAKLKSSTSGKLSSGSLFFDADEADWAPNRSTPTNSNLILPVTPPLTEAGLNASQEEKPSKDQRATPTLVPALKPVSQQVVRLIFADISAIRAAAGKEKEVCSLCMRVLDALEDKPNAAKALVAAHGVLAITELLDMAVEAASASSSASASASGSVPGPEANQDKDKDKDSAVPEYLMRVVNAVVAEDLESNNQLAMAGGLPTLLRLVDCLHKRALTAASASSAQPLLRQGSFGSVQAATMALSECAAMLYEVSSHSSLALKVLIGTGGQQALVQLLSTALHIIRWVSQRVGGRSNTNNTNTNTNTNSSATEPQPQPSREARRALGAAAEAWDLASVASNGDDASTFSSRSLHTPFGTTTHHLGDAECELIENAKRIIYMSVDCITSVFKCERQQGRSCGPIFIRLGLLPPLGRAFSLLLSSYRHACQEHARQKGNAAKALRQFQPLQPTTEAAGTGTAPNPHPTPSDASATTSESAPPSHPRRRDLQNLESRESFTSASAVGRSSQGEDSHQASEVSQLSRVSRKHAALLLMSNATLLAQPEERLECKYALRLAMLMRLFTHSDLTVLEALTRPESGILPIIMTALQSSELRPSLFTRNYSAASLSSSGQGGSVSAAPPMTPNSSAAASTPTQTPAPTPLPTPTHAGASRAGDRQVPPSGSRSHPPTVLTHWDLSEEHLVIIDTLLKCVKNVSIEIATVASLDKAATVVTLVALLNGPYGTRFQEHVIPALFNLCRLNRWRQEQAAVSGVIPSLMRVIAQDDANVKPFALTMMCDLAYATQVTRIELWRHDGVAFYTSLFCEPHWQASALNALANWLSHDVANVEVMLMASPQISRLIDLFRCASQGALVPLLGPFIGMMAKSPALCRYLGASGLFVRSLVERISDNVEAFLLRSYVNILQLVHKHHSCPRKLVLDFSIYERLRRLAASTLTARQVVVLQKVKLLLGEIQLSTLS